MTDTSKLLHILETHGQEFLSSFPPTIPRNGSNKRKRQGAHQNTLSEDEEEWGGIATDDETEDNDLTVDEDFEHDDCFHADSSKYDNVVVFSDAKLDGATSASLPSKAQVKAFMSSKINNLRADHPRAGVQPTSQVDREDERTNAQNDALLHKLVHTKLLSGALDTKLDLTAAQRRKALAGRVLELSGTAKLGSGEKVVRVEERNKSSKQVREGLARKQRERVERELSEAKNLGNYHPTLKKMYNASGPQNKRKREKGLGMGVGKFSGGLLRLSRDEIDRASRGQGRPAQRRRS